MWAKVWQHAGRVEEIPNVGDYLTYDIGDDSIVIVRSAPDTIKAYHNVCSHRGRRLVDTPPGAHSALARRNAVRLRLSLPGGTTWTASARSSSTSRTGRAHSRMTCTRLNEVKVDTWGGWIFINMDPNGVPLREYLEPAASILDPFEFAKMRYKWRQWVVFDCNWKTAIEAFMEPYHVAGTHHAAAPVWPVLRL